MKKEKEEKRSGALNGTEEEHSRVKDVLNRFVRRRNRFTVSESHCCNDSGRPALPLIVSLVLTMRLCNNEEDIRSEFDIKLKILDSTPKKRKRKNTWEEREKKKIIYQKILHSEAMQLSLPLRSPQLSQGKVVSKLFHCFESSSTLTLMFLVESHLNPL